MQPLLRVFFPPYLHPFTPPSESVNPRKKLPVPRPIRLLAEQRSLCLMNLQSLPAVTGAPYSASMSPSSSTFSTVITHGSFPYLTPSTTHPSHSGILPSDMISYSGLPEQPSGGNFSGLSPEATDCADPPGDGMQNNIGIYNVENQQIPGSVRTVDESEWLRSLVGDLDDIITTDVTPNCHQMAEPTPVPSYLNSKSWQHDEHMVHQSVSVPSEPQQLYPTVSPLATTNAHYPKRAKARMRWTMEMHDRFVDAVNLLGGSESAKPKAILDIMNVEGLTRDQVKSHLQKYKMAQVKHHPSEVPGTSVKTTMCNEVIPSDVQKHIQEYALQVQVDFQKKLHDMVERTLREIHRSILENHASLHELEQRQSYRGTLRPIPGPAAACPAAPPAALSAAGSRGVHGEPSNTAAPDDEGDLVNKATEAGSPGNDAGA